MATERKRRRRRKRQRIEFLPCSVMQQVRVDGGNMVFDLAVDLPEPSESVGGYWVFSYKVFFTDGKDIFTGYMKYPSPEGIVKGLKREWETVEGVVHSVEEVKGWIESKCLEIATGR